jgi:SAM-dependent methyltransferase
MAYEVVVRSADRLDMIVLLGLTWYSSKDSRRDGMAEVSAPIVDPSNAEQLRAWDGDEGAYWAAHAERFDRAVAGYDEPFAAAAAVSPTDRVLDVGCGTGQTTRAAARVATAGTAHGVDLSSQMVDAARHRADAEGIANATFEQADAQIHPFHPGVFDLVISRTGASFFGDPVAAFRNIGRALRPAGRLAMLTWQSTAQNEWIRELSGALAAGRDLPLPPPGAPGPFAFADPEHVRTVLGAAGFTDVELEPVRTEMWFGVDADDAYGFVLGLLDWMLGGLDDAGRTKALDGLRATTVAHETDHGVVYESATWIVRARRA